MRRGILYLSYDGMLEPLGQSQVLAYLEPLAVDRRIDLISFEKKADRKDREAFDAVAQRCRSAGISWHPLRYHKQPSALATAWDIAVGGARAAAIAVRRRPAVIHARSYVPGLMALAAKQASGGKFLFDMRGLWADERVDGELWPKGGGLYRAAKRAETALLASADHIVTLTHASVEELRRLPGLAGRDTPITVIPTCADLDRFSPSSKRKSAGAFTIGHIGSVGTWYLLNEMVRCFAALRRIVPEARWLIVNRGEHDQILAALRRHGGLEQAVEIIAAEPADMPALIARMDAGMAIIKPAYSKIASAPTKLAEYLGCGVPCLGNSGVGDVQAILDGRQVGITLHQFDETAITAAVTELIDIAAKPGIAERCRAAALDLFALDKGVAEYRRIYAALER